MSTYTDTVVPPLELVEHPARFRSGVRTLVVTLSVLAFLWLASSLVPFFIRHTRLETKLTSAISAALGRPVQVGSYDLALLSGPTLVARTVSVAEDPRFGAEYFVRADSMSLQLNWKSAIRGHIEPTGIFLNHPTLNLARNGAGDWNLAEWLPKPSVTGQAALSGSSPRRSLGPGFTAIEVDGGRINFKRGYDKLPFALINLSGRAATDSSGRWQLDVTATPWRAAVDVQQVGTLHASGYVGGTSSRFWPAALNISWSDASLPDFLRLVAGDDHGIRGELAGSVNAATRNGDGSWSIDAFAQVSQVHRWDLPLRADNPAVNLQVKTNWNPADSSVEFDDVRFEAPRSNGRFSVKILPPVPGGSTKGKVDSRPLFSWEISSAQVDAGDLLAWLRAFRNGASDGVAARGVLSIEASASDATVGTLVADISTSGVTVAGLPALLELGSFHLHFDRGRIAVPSAALALGSVGGTLKLEASSRPGRDPVNHIRASGEVADAHSLLADARAFGWDIAHGWDVAGPLDADLHWDETFPIAGSGWILQPTGSIDWGSGDSPTLLRAPFLNLPIAEIKARLDLKPGARHIALSTARAFGGEWSGSIDGTAVNSQWAFVLSADHLAAADLDRWLNPRWRESFLDRMLPFLSSSSSGAPATFPGMFAAGHLDIAQFALGSWNFGHLGGDLRINGRRIEFDNASAQLSRGTAQGQIAVELGPVSAYAADVAFTHIDLSTLTDTVPSLAGLFDGSASGEITLETRGNSRADVLAALTCSGNARINLPQLLQLDLMASLGNMRLDPGSSRFPVGGADFHCANRIVTFAELTLSSAVYGLQASGTVDFSRNLDLAMRRTSDSGASPPEFHISGTLADPRFTLAAAAVRRAR